LASNTIRCCHKHNFNSANTKLLKLLSDRGISGHAERILLSRNVGRNLSNCTLVVVRLKRNRTLANVSPCSVCAPIINYFGIRKMWCSNEDGTFHYNDGRYIVGNPSSGTRNKIRYGDNIYK
jgi:tRNA(Arg) A34 adenosine deaminase TadA